MRYYSLDKEIEKRLRKIKKLGYTKSLHRENVNEEKNDDYPIDFVVTWVDNTDPNWLKDKEYYEKESSIITKKDNSDVRYREWGSFKYWFRSIEANAPWVRNVYLVTYGHIPEWLDTYSEKIRIIKHEDFIPKQYLPTFNSRVIELNLWRIEELSEHFVYFNDDTYLANSVSRDFFFSGGFPKYCSTTRPYYPYSNMSSFDHVLYNNIGLINDNYDIRKVMEENPEKWFPAIYEQGIYYNERTYLDGYLSGMYCSHLCVPYRKSSLKECANEFNSFFDRTCKNRFRAYTDINHPLFQIWEMVHNNFEPVNANYYGIVKNMNKHDIDTLESFLLSSKHRCICLNDNELLLSENFDNLKESLVKAFEKKYPSKSIFEK